MCLAIRLSIARHYISLDGYEIPFNKGVLYDYVVVDDHLQSYTIHRIVDVCTVQKKTAE